MDDNERNAHQFFAVQCFNGTWDLIEKTNRTPDEDAEMLTQAFTSRWHWGFVGGEEQWATGEWQIAHVASLLGFGVLAQVYAQRNLERCEANGWSDWRLASAYEGMARAAAAGGDAEGHAKYYALAREAIAAIAEEGERNQIAAQLATVPLP